MSARRTVLAVVLERDGAECRCAGGCGVEHAGRRCGAEPTERAALIVAPYPLPLTEHETAAAPVSELRPWCGTCWRRARKRNTELAAELRRQELDEAQMPLFDVESAGGGR
ncbi:hypothetical protein ABZ745_35095 [Streptomyces sp. NPDC013082]|uniref:hypothetical protein n=1 Tax=Streptomyces sp. NPDC013082 TaxID=3156686 RepID=UPI0034112D4B